MEASQNLTGVWSGRYFYPRELPPVSFVATLIETATSLTGTTHEPAGPATDAVRYASLQGQRDGNAVSFIKTYDNAGLNVQPDPLQRHSERRRHRDRRHLADPWKSGPAKFLMIRSPGKVAAVARKVAERV